MPLRGADAPGDCCETSSLCRPSRQAAPPRALAMVGLVMMKLRHNLTGRALEALAGINAVTLSRYVRRVTALLGTLPLCMRQPRGFLLVDTTSVRAGGTDHHSFSGHLLLPDFSAARRCRSSLMRPGSCSTRARPGRDRCTTRRDKTARNKERISLGEALGTLILAHPS